MPRTRVTVFAARSAASGDRIGIPPPTAASKRNATPARRAIVSRFGTVVGDDVLVGGDDRFAAAERGGDQGSRRLVATHQLDDDVGLGRGDQVGRRIGQEIGRNAGTARAIEVPAGDADEHQGPRRRRRTVDRRAPATRGRPRRRRCPRRARRPAAGQRSSSWRPARTEATVGGHRANGSRPVPAVAHARRVIAVGYTREP